LLFLVRIFFVSIPASKFCEKVGFANGMSYGLLITALGTFGLMSSSKLGEFAVFLVSFFILAGGITLIQVAANPYVSLLGNKETASSRLTLVQAFNSLGTTVAPLVGTAVILSSQEKGSIERPYLILTFLIIVLAIAVKLFNLPKIVSEQNTQSQDTSVSIRDLLKNKRLFYGVIGIFTYVGAEVAIGSLLINWLGEPSVRGFTHEEAGKFVAFYWGGAMVGRFLGTPLLARFSVPKILQLFVSGALTLVVISMLTQGELAQWSILLVGFFNSILFPTIFSQSIEGLKVGTEKASGLLCAAIVGGALIPLLQGVIADQAGLRISFIIPVLCYGYLFFFATKLKRL
jgi:FHS family L-fucose permease-like MFS transporter